MMDKRLWLGAKIVACLGAIAAYVYSNSMNPEPSADRVKVAQERAGATVQQLCADAGLAYPPKRLFIRAFKAEKVMEIWGASAANAPFKHIQTYPIAAMSGTLGPKRREGDLQVPEGFYYIDRFNPKSRFWLSLGLNYPNTSDRILSDKSRPGGDIFIHGNAVSIGCMAMTDKKIDEIYLLALGARNGGQTRINVHVFPFRMTESNLERHAGSPLIIFWNTLKPVHDAFQTTLKVPTVKVDSKGKYSLVKPKSTPSPNNP